jgi:hypothetical protein
MCEGFIRDRERDSCVASATSVDLDSYLAGKYDHGDEPEPGMQGVEVGFGGFGVVVRVEGGLEPHDGQDEGRSVKERVEDLEALLGGIPAGPVDQHGWKGVRQWWPPAAAHLHWA